MGTVHIAFGDKDIFIQLIVVWDDKTKIFVQLETAHQFAAPAFEHFDNFSLCPAVFGSCEEAHLHPVHVQGTVQGAGGNKNILIYALIVRGHKTKASGVSLKDSGNSFFVFDVDIALLMVAGNFALPHHLGQQVVQHLFIFFIVKIQKVCQILKAHRPVSGVFDYGLHHLF